MDVDGEEAKRTRRVDLSTLVVWWDICLPHAVKWMQTVEGWSSGGQGADLGGDVAKRINGVLALAARLVSAVRRARTNLVMLDWRGLGEVWYAVGGRREKLTFGLLTVRWRIGQAGGRGDRETGEKEGVGAASQELWESGEMLGAGVRRRKEECAIGNGGEEGG